MFEVILGQPYRNTLLVLLTDANIHFQAEWNRVKILAAFSAVWYPIQQPKWLTISWTFLEPARLHPLIDLISWASVNSYRTHSYQVFLEVTVLLGRQSNQVWKFLVTFKHKAILLFLLFITSCELGILLSYHTHFCCGEAPPKFLGKPK